jgi:hypothetical protein
MPTDEEDNIELKTFFCSVNKDGIYEVGESRTVDDGGVKRMSLLTGDGDSTYGALAKLCFMKMEIDGRQSEIIELCKYYMTLYGNAGY